MQRETRRSFKRGLYWRQAFITHFPGFIYTYISTHYIAVNSVVCKLYTCSMFTCLYTMFHWANFISMVTVMSHSHSAAECCFHCATFTRLLISLQLISTLPALMFHIKSCRAVQRVKLVPFHSVAISGNLTAVIEMNEVDGNSISDKKRNCSRLWYLDTVVLMELVMLRWIYYVIC